MAPFGDRKVGEPELAPQSDEARTDDGLKRFVLSSNFTLPALLSRGAILAPAAGEEGGLKWLDSWGNSLPQTTGRFPLGWIEEVTQSARNAFPIGLEVNGERDFVEATGIGRLDCISLEDVAAIIFRSDAEKRRFLSWSFGNMPTLGLETLSRVEASLFEGDATSHQKAQEEVEQTSDQSRDAVRRADALAALVAVSLTLSRGLRDWIVQLGDVDKPLEKARSRVKAFTAQLVQLLGEFHQGPSSTDDSILAAAIRSLLRHTPETGWPALEILEEVRIESERGLPDDGVQEVRVWAHHCREVIDAKTSPPPLLDDKSIVRRALLLLLLRETIEEIERVPVDSALEGISAGPNVRMLALMLAAIRTGFRRLPVICKIVRSSAGELDLRMPLGRLFLEDYRIRMSRESWHLPRPINVSQVAAQGGGLEWSIELAGLATLAIPMAPSPMLSRLAGVLRGIGHEVKVEAERVLVESSDRVQLPIEARQYEPNNGKHGYVQLRCAVPTKKAEPGKRRPAKPKPITSMPKDFFLQLLQRQMTGPSPVRYAVSEDGKSLYVVVDAKLDTLDEATAARLIDELVLTASRTMLS